MKDCFYLKFNIVKMIVGRDIINDHFFYKREYINNSKGGLICHI